MGAGAINPFYTARQSQRMSHFVDESLPVDLMLKAGVAKQGQQDKMTDLLNTVGTFDADAIKGGDTSYLDATRDEVNKFVESNIGRDLTSPQAQSDVYKFTRTVAGDKKLKQISKNYEKVQQMNDTIAKLQASGNQAFDPSVALAKRSLESYIKSGKMGEEFGDLSIEKALDLHQKEQTYFDQMKAEGSQWFDEDMKNLKEKGMFAKKGWAGIKDSRIAKRAKDVAQDYANSPEGGQALALYREHKLSGTLPDPNMSANDFLADRLLRTGMEYSYSKSQVQAIQDPVAAAARSKKQGKPSGVIIDEAAQTKKLKIDIKELKKTINNPDASPLDKSAAQAQIDRIENKVNLSEAGKGIQQTLTDLLKIGDDGETTLPKLSGSELSSEAENSAQNFMSLATTDSEGNEIVPSRLNVLQKLSDEKRVSNSLKPVFDKLSSLVEPIYKEEILNNHNANLARALHDGDVFTFNTKEKDDGTKAYSIGINGTDKEWTLEELGFQDVSMLRDAEQASTQVGEAAANLQAIGNSIRGAGKAYSVNSFWSDATDKIKGAIKTYDKEVQELGEGTTIQPGTTFRPASKKEVDSMKSILSNANPALFEATDENNENIEAFELENLLANVGASSISVRPSRDSRQIEITRTIPIQSGPNKGVNKKETFVIQEKAGKRQGTFDDLFEAGGDTQLDAMTGASDRLQSYATNQPINLVNLVGSQYSDALPSGIDPGLTVALNTGAEGGYVVGDVSGTFTNAETVQKIGSLIEAYGKRTDLSEEKKQQIQIGLKQKEKSRYKNTLIQSGISEDVAEFIYEAQQSGEDKYLNQIDQSTWDLVNNALNSNFVARNYKDIYDIAGIMSSIR